jgi:hypothetical protein
MASLTRTAAPTFSSVGTLGSRFRFPWLARLLRERLVQFVVFGGAIFFASSRARPADDAIVFSAAELAALRDAEAQKKGAAASSSLEAEVRERAVEDEVLYREGLRLGFDKDDGVVRQRIIQKTLYLAEELAGASEAPTESELRGFFESTRAEWRRSEEWSLVQIFAHDRATLEGIRARAVRGENVDRLGDACPVPRESRMTSDRLASLLGPEFVTALSKAPSDAFSAPIASSLGWHLVRVVDHAPGGPASFDDVKGALRGAFVVKRREDAVASFLDRAFKKYRVSLEGQRLDGIAPHGRVAVRPSTSAED